MEMCLGAGCFWAGEVGPVADIEFGLPYGRRTQIQNETYFWRKGAIDLVREAYAKHGVYFLCPAGGGTESLVSKFPITGPDDYKGKRIQDTGPEGKLATLWGASTIVLPPGDLYTALSTGVVDAVGFSGPYQMFGQYKLYEVAKYISDSGRISSAHILINLEKWEALPDDLKATLEACGQVMSSDYNQFAYNEDRRCLNEAVEKYGVTVTGMSPALAREACDVTWDYYGAQDPLAAKLIEILREYLTEIGER
jgi:TRAP-type C4-dicarboxylate transport system substrate-binding protein